MNTLYLSATKTQHRRVTLGLSYNDFSLRLKYRNIFLAPSKLSKWERGLATLSLSQPELYAFADALQIPLAQLLEESPKEQTAA